MPRIDEQIVKWLIPQITEDCVEELKIVPLDQFPEKICEQIVNVPVSQVDEQDVAQRAACIMREKVEGRRAFEFETILSSLFFLVEIPTRMHASSIWVNSRFSVPSNATLVIARTNYGRTINK